MTTLSVNSSALAALLRDVRQAARKDDGMLPMLSGVLLHTAQDDAGRTLLVASASDRFILLQGHAETEGAGLTDPVWLTNGQVSQLLATLRPYTTRRLAEASRTDIDLIDGRVSFTQADQGIDLGAISMTVRHDKGNFPDILRLLKPALEAAPSAEPFVMNGKTLTVVTRIAEWRREYLRMRSTGKNKAVLVQIGRHLVALVMPVRPGENDHLDIPVYGVPVLSEAVAA